MNDFNPASTRFLRDSVVAGVKFITTTLLADSLLSPCTPQILSDV